MRPLHEQSGAMQQAIYRVFGEQLMSVAYWAEITAS